MLQPLVLPLRVDRNVLCRRVIAFIDFNFTGATFKAAIKETPDAAGSALVSLTTQTTDAQGVRLLYSASDTVQNHILAGRISDVPPGLELTTNVYVSQVQIKIDKTTMENASIFPLPQERGDDQTYYWDLLITPSGGDEDKYAGGGFIIQGGAQT